MLRSREVFNEIFTETELTDSFYQKISRNFTSFYQYVIHKSANDNSCVPKIGGLSKFYTTGFLLHCF